jgi:hypothetical protein
MSHPSVLYSGECFIVLDVYMYNYLHRDVKRRSPES